MCNFWSAILTRDGVVLWDRDITSHEEIIQKHGLNDKKLADRDFVRIEITPNDITSKKKSDWRYKLDEPSTAPDWYANDPMTQEKKVWAEWMKMITQLHDSLKASNLNFERKASIIERVTKMKPGDATVSR